MENEKIEEKFNKLTPSQKKNLEDLIDLFIKKNATAYNKSTDN